MVHSEVSVINNVTLNRRGYSITGTLLLTAFHVVFNYRTNATDSPENSREIWICYPVIERIHKARGSSLVNKSAHTNLNGNGEENDPYSASHIRLQCKDFTFYSFDFINDYICGETFVKLSELIMTPKTTNDIKSFYAFYYECNMLEEALNIDGWKIYNPVKEYQRLGLLNDFWRATNINDDYRFCPSYPNLLISPNTISDNVLKHAAKFRSKSRIPSVVYKHRGSPNGNVIARCSQPLVGLKQHRSIQDEKLISEIFRCQDEERKHGMNDDEISSQPQRNLIVDLRPITNAMAQHAVGAGSENIDNYRESYNGDDPDNKRGVDKIFCNIDNIHVMRDSLNKLTTILNDLDKYPVSSETKHNFPLLAQSLTKTQWLHRISIILQSVDRITKSIHLNNTNVVIHCSDGWDRTSQVSALSQLCLDPYYRTIEGFIVLIEKEWLSFGFKFSTRADHGGCIGALFQKKNNNQSLSQSTESSAESTPPAESEKEGIAANAVASFLQKAATHIKNTAAAASSTASSFDDIKENGRSRTIYNESTEKSPVFHQFLDCVYQIYRQNHTKFEFNSRFLKRLLYHYYSCQYGTFLGDSERLMKEGHKIHDSTTSVWDYFLSRVQEFSNPSYEDNHDNGVVFFNYSDIKWWNELYGRSNEEMNGLSNSLEKKLEKLKIVQ